MSPHEVIFILVAIATGLSAVMTVTSRNLVHAALFLAATLAGIGGVFLVLHADFVALVQLVVYVGAVAVLFLFGLMLTRAPIGREALDSQNRALGAGVAVALFAALVVLILQAFAGVATQPLAGPTIADLGLAIFTTWVLPFEAVSMLLLGALIGAIVLSRRETGSTGEEAEAVHIQLGTTPPGEPGRPEPVATDAGGGEA